jgi:hypothetical protein
VDLKQSAVTADTNDGAPLAGSAPTATPQVHSRPEPRRGWRLPSRRAAGTATLTLGLPLLVFAVHARRYGRWIVDDAAISYAYARSIADGHGVVQQPGAPRVEGFSNPLWTGLLVLLKWLGLFDSGRTLAGWPDYVFVPRLIAVAGLLGTAGVLWWAFRPLIGERAWLAALLAGLGLAVNPSYVAWVISGLENPLYAVLVAALAAVLVRAAATGRLTSSRVALATGVLALLCALTRPDGAVYVGAYPLLLLLLLNRARLRASVRGALLSGLAFGVPMVAFLLARHAMFGLWVPNTAVAKAQQGLTAEGMAKVSALVGYVGWPVVLTAAALVGVAAGLGWQRSPGTAATRRSSAAAAAQGSPGAATAQGSAARSRPDARLWPGLLGLLVCLLAAIGAFGVLEPDWMLQYRFATPIWVTGTALFAVCLVWALGSGAVPRRGVAVLAAVAALSVLLSGALLRTQSNNFRAAPTIPMCYVADRYGRLFNTYADRLGIGDAVRPSGTSVPTLALPDIGGTLLTTRFQVIDTAGLTDRTIAEARQRRDFDAIGDYLFDQVKPTFIHYHDPWARGIEGDPRLARDYEEIVPGDYVRRDAVADRQGLQRLRVERLDKTVPRDRSSCGDRLSPGSTLS